MAHFITKDKASLRYRFGNHLQLASIDSLEYLEIYLNLGRPPVSNGSHERELV